MENICTYIEYIYTDISFGVRVLYTWIKQPITGVVTFCVHTTENSCNSSTSWIYEREMNRMIGMQEIKIIQKTKIIIIITHTTSLNCKALSSILKQKWLYGDHFDKIDPQHNYLSLC